jgi:hypothetical protein
MAIADEAVTIDFFVFGTLINRYFSVNLDRKRAEGNQQCSEYILMVMFSFDT